MEKTNQTTDLKVGDENPVNRTSKVNAPSVYLVSTQKQKIAAEKDCIEAIYFDGDKRLLTYAGISYQTATLKLIELQNREHKAITMIVLNEDVLPVGMTSRDKSDYMKYVVAEAN